MIYAVYFVPREGVHPNATLEDYGKLWPIMHRSVNRLGHKLVHITDMHTESWGDDVYRVDVSAETTVYSRDVAWARFVADLGSDTAVMVEPDTLMLKDVPDIRPNCDLCVLRRPESCVPGWFKMSRKASAPFYEDVVRSYAGLPSEMLAFHGDIKALHKTLGIPDGQKAHTIPSHAAGCKIDVRDWHRYGFRKTSDQFFLQFKGTSKQDMLAYGDTIL